MPSQSSSRGGEIELVAGLKAVIQTNQQFQLALHLMHLARFLRSNY
jgi:hypothetical protein